MLYLIIWGNDFSTSLYFDIARYHPPKKFVEKQNVIGQNQPSLAPKIDEYAIMTTGLQTGITRKNNCTLLSSNHQIFYWEYDPIHISILATTKIEYTGDIILAFYGTFS